MFCFLLFWKLALFSFLCLFYFSCVWINYIHLLQRVYAFETKPSGYGFLEDGKIQYLFFGNIQFDLWDFWGDECWIIFLLYLMLGVFFPSEWCSTLPKYLIFVARTALFSFWCFVFFVTHWRWGYSSGTCNSFTLSLCLFIFNLVC